MQLDSNQRLTIIGLIIAIIIGSGYYIYNHLFIPESPQNLIIDPPLTRKNGENSVFVHISGAVKREGVYKVKDSDKVCDVINLAGGTLPGADFSSINLAEKVEDGRKIVVPATDYRQQRTGQATDSSLQSTDNKTRVLNKVNLNLSSLQELEELESLPGIGAITAKKIVEARPFSKIDDLLKIPRFGKKKFDQLKDLVVI